MIPVKNDANLLLFQKGNLVISRRGGGGGGTPYDGLYGEAPPEMGIFFRLQVYERLGILLFEVY